MSEARGNFLILGGYWSEQGVIFLIEGQYYIIIGTHYLKFDIMPFLDQKWLRLGTDFSLGALLAEARDKFHMFKISLVRLGIISYQ